MSHMRLAMDAAFWDLNVSSTQTLAGSAHLVPGEFFPVTANAVGRIPRPLQLGIIRNRYFPLYFPFIPAISPTDSKELGNFVLQAPLLKLLLQTKDRSFKWWVGLMGQLRPKNLLPVLKAEVAAIEDFDMQTVKDIMRHLYEKSIYAVGLWTHASLTRNLDLYYSIEGDNDKGRRSKATFFHKLRHHDLTLEAAWAELFIDKKGSYWEVPESISLDLASVNKTGLGYRIGIHKSNGDPKPLSETCGDIPLALMPGLYAKAAFSYQMKLDLWRKKLGPQPLKRIHRMISYDLRLRDPHASISGIIGGTYTVLLGGRKDSGGSSGDENFANRFSDFFGAVCFSLQVGRFTRIFADLTRIDARLDICSAKAYIKRKTEASPQAIPQLNVIFHQQILGPMVFRIDAKYTNPPGKLIPTADDIVYNLCYPVQVLPGHPHVVAWYSPKRREGMIELRAFEFES